MCFQNTSTPGNTTESWRNGMGNEIVDAEFREITAPALSPPEEIAMSNAEREAARAQARHKLHLILMSRRYWFEHGSREAARRVTQELFDLAFSPGELDVLR